MRSLFGAVAFLTILPVPKRYRNQDPADSAAFFPLVGALLGIILAGADYSLSYTTLTTFTQSTLVITLLLLLTGMLHMDGLADTADALFAPHKTKEERLKILKETRVGVFGMTTLLLITLLKIGSLQNLHLTSRYTVILLFPVVSRTSILLPALLFPYARRSGTARSFINRMRYPSLVVAVLICGAVSVACMGLDGLVSMAVAFSVSLILSALCYKKFGGITGDTLGAAVELSELSILIFFAFNL